MALCENEVSTVKRSRHPAPVVDAAANDPAVSGVTGDGATVTTPPTTTVAPTATVPPTRTAPPSTATTAAGPTV